MFHDRDMTATDRSGPDPEAIVTHITETWPETDVVPFHYVHPVTGQPIVPQKRS